MRVSVGCVCVCTHKSVFKITPDTAQVDMEHDREIKFGI